MTYVPVYGPCCKIVVVKAFQYRQETQEEFSSGYTFSPVNTPVNDTQWNVFCENIRAAEMLIYHNDVKFHRAYGYNSNDPKAAHVFAVDWEALGQVFGGSFAPAGTSVKGAGDQAAVVEWQHSVKSAKGKPVYFRKYCHEPYVVSGGGDYLAAEYVSALQSYADYFKVYLGGQYSTKYPTGNIVTAKVLPYVTTRTLKRRGKRPRPA